MTEMDYLFINYVAKFNKQYATSEEYNFRFLEFVKRVHQMEEHAKDTSATYQIAFNKFSDWTESEYKKVLGYKVPKGIV